MNNNIKTIQDVYKHSMHAWMLSSSKAACIILAKAKFQRQLKHLNINLHCNHEVAMKIFCCSPLSAKVEINNRQATALSPLAIVV